MHYLANVRRLEHFLAKEPPPPGMSTFWLMSQGLSTFFWLRAPPPSGHDHFLANVSGHEQFLAKDPPPSRHEHFLAYVPGLEHFLLAKSPPLPLGMTTFLANVSGHEHFLAKPPPPLWALALFGLPARRYAIDIQIALLFVVFFNDWSSAIVKQVITLCLYVSCLYFTFEVFVYIENLKSKRRAESLAQW